MVIVHENGKVYKVQLRGAYSKVRSEKKFRAMVARGIESYKTRSPEYAEALSKKSLFEVCRLFGIITQKWEIKNG